MDKHNRIDKADLFKERSLWDFLWVFPRSFSKIPIAYYLSFFSISISAPLLICGRYFQGGTDGVSSYLTDESIAKFIGTMASGGLTLGVGVLSVIIAGFAIFASSSDVELTRLLIKSRRKQYVHGRELSETRPNIIFVYSVFTYAMSTFAALTASSLFSLVVSDTAAAPYKLLQGLSSKILSLSLIVVAVLLVAQIVFTFSILKSFIWNMLQVMLQMSALKVELKSRGSKN